MTLFGWIYAFLTAYGILAKINEIGKERKPVSSAEASVHIVLGLLLFAGLYYWGLQ